MRLLELEKGRVIMIIGSAFGIVSLAYCILMAIVYLYKRKANNTRSLTSLFYGLLIFGVIVVGIIEIICVWAIAKVNNPPLVEILCRIHILVDIIIFTLAIVYCYVATVDDSNLTKYNKIRRFLGVFVIIFDAAVYSITLFLPIEYNAVINPNWVLFRGPALYPVYILGLIVCFLSSYLIWHYRKTNPKELTIPAAYFGVTFIIFALIEVILFDNGINYIYALIAYFMIGTFFTIESQDTKLLKDAEESREAAETANKAKSNFLASVSHAIRTPMNTVLGFSQSMLEERDLKEERVKSDAKEIKAASTDLLELINNILDISRIESGKETIEVQDYRIEEVLMEVNSFIVSKISKDQIDFKINVDSNIPISYKGDSDKLYKIIVNVLMNAIKSTSFGNVSLDVGGAYVGSVFKLSLIISNSGHAMSEEEFNKDFDEFSDESNSQGTSKEKLGLIVAKRLIALMNGTIDFKNETGKGTRYIISLDQDVVDDMKIGNIFIESVGSNEDKPLDLTGLSALLVDDNNVNLKLATRFLKQFNLDVTSATNGQECLDLVKNNTYDIIFLDHMMPGMDGVEAVHALRDNGNDMPIIALTANSYSGSREKYIAEGFTDYLPKPFQYKELNKILKKYMGE